MKLSSIEKILNQIVIIIFVFFFVLCLISTILGVIFLSTYYDNQNSSAVYGLKIFGSFFILMNTLIPISIIITMEIVKGFQAFKIEFDSQLKNKDEDKVKVLSMRLQEDLGNLSYIFTDKTGTLTRNEMEFRACSIFTRLFYDEDNATVGALTENTKKNVISKSFDMKSLIEALNNDHPLDIYSNEHNFSSYREVVMEFFINIILNHNVIHIINNRF